MPINSIVAGIRSYATAYAEFQHLQDNHRDLLAPGDQKTGVIGEFYGMLFAKATYPGATVAYSEDPSQTGWDLQVTANPSGPDLRIQVKTVSGYSTTRAITPLFPGWDHLYLFYLGRDLLPTGFWIVTTTAVMAGADSLRGLKMRRPDYPQSGSPAISWGENRIMELRQLVPAIWT
jgi:hypothetical protein